MTKYAFGLPYEEKIRCDYTNMETVGILTEMLNDDYARQRIQHDAKTIDKLDDIGFQDYMRKLIWITIDYTRVEWWKVREVVRGYAKV